MFAEHFDDLAHDAVRVDDGLADGDALVRADIQHDARPERIEIDVDEPRELHRKAEAVLRVEQILEPRVLRDERIEPVEPRLREQQRVAKLAVFLRERVLRDDGRARRARDVGRQRRDAIDRFDQRARQAAQIFEIAGAVIERPSAVAARPR